MKQKVYTHNTTTTKNKQTNPQTKHGVLDIPSDIPFKKAVFFFFFIYEQVSMQIASWLGWTPCRLPPLSARTLSVLDLCSTWVSCLSLCGFLCALVLLCPWRHCFLGVIHHLWLLQSFCLCFCIDP